MSQKLLIVGAGTYAVVAAEIAADMGIFEKIDFIDDGKTQTPNGIPVAGTTQQLSAFSQSYDSIVVAIGNPEVRLSLLSQIEEQTSFRITSLISPKAYIAPSAHIESGCIIEPMAVVHSGCVLARGCIVSAGAVINHASKCSEGVHVDCNATVAGYCIVPAGTKIGSGTVYKSEETVNPEEVFLRKK